MPRLSGEEISKKAKSNLDYTRKFLQMTQIYTIPFVSFFGTPATMSKGIDSSLGLVQQLGGIGNNIETDVVVYEHMDKEGISSEIITAKTAFGLYDYLKKKGLKIENGSIPVLNKYIGKEYAFIASWITDNSINKVNNPDNLTEGLFKIRPTRNDPYKTRGIFVTFPTKEIYFPLLPTSVYGSKTVPATIRINGYVSPKIFQDIKNYTKIDYYVDSYANFSEDLRNFYNGENKNVKYTKIEINAPSKFLTDDLWISNVTPIKTNYSTFFAMHSITSALLLLILSSVITGILTGWIIFKELRKNIIKLGLIGLSNCLSILGLLITTMFAGTIENNENAEITLTEIKQKGYFWKRKLAIILLILDLPFLLISIFFLVNFDIFYTLDQLTASFVPYVVLIFVLLISRIKSEDKILFDQLKTFGYSSWSFQPKDRMKILFIPIFSISYIVISWCLVKFVWFIV